MSTRSLPTIARSKSILTSRWLWATRELLCWASHRTCTATSTRCSPPPPPSLDAALADQQGIIDIGGPGAVTYFKQQRARIRGGAAQSPPPAVPEWDDPYLSWCRDKGLFLHISQACITPDLDRLDPL